MARPEKRNPPEPLFYRPRIVLEPTPEEISAAACTLFDLGKKSCRWPLGPEMEPATHNTLFCGAVAIDGCSYCPRHAARAYRAETWRGAPIKNSGPTSLPEYDVPASERAAARNCEPTGTNSEVGV
jgi:hypothetical protein